MMRTSSEQALYDRYREFGCEHIRPHVRSKDQTHHFDREGFAKLGELDFYRIPVRKELGGLGLGPRAYAAALEGLADGSADLGFSVSVVAHMVCLAALERFGTPEQFDSYLPRLLSGEWLGGVANAEAQAGTNLMALACVAQRDGDEYVLNGQKHCVTNVGLADLVMVSARLQDAPARKGINVFLTETDNPGVSMQVRTDLAGLRTSCTGNLQADQANFPSRSLLGQLGDGLAIFACMFEQERLFTGVLYLSALRACRHRALEHAETRLQFGRPIGRNQYVQERIIRMRVDEELLDCLLKRLLGALERGDTTSETLSIVKVHGIEAAIQASESLMRLLGGRGMSQQELAEKYHRDLLALSILGGTVELQKMVLYGELARQVGRPSAPERKCEVTLTLHDTHALEPILEQQLIELTARIFPNEPALAHKFYYDTRPDVVVVAWQDGKLVGFRIVTWRNVMVGQGLLRVAGLGIGVDPEYQKRGIGTELTRRTLELLREEGSDLALAFLFHGQSEPLLQSFGFRRLNVRVSYLHPDTGELVEETMPASALDLNQGTLLDDLEALSTLHLGVGTW